MATAARPRPSDHVDAIRRFNRFYTRQIGILQDGVYKSPYSLTEVRVLYELAQRDQPTASELCKDLGLDRGYLSRMLRSFEKQGIIVRKSAATDARQHHVSLTAHGRKVFAPLNQRSADDVARMLQPLSPAQQSRLVESARAIETLLDAKPAPAGYCRTPH